MNTIESDWNNTLVFDFLELYRSEPVLWDPSDRHHKSKQKVNDAWCRVSAEMNKPVPELKGKKKCLMATFRSLLKKKKASMVPGASSDDIYEPVWFAYGFMESFLGKIYDREDSSSTYSTPSVPTSGGGNVYNLFPLSSNEASNFVEVEERRSSGGGDEVMSNGTATHNTRRSNTEQLKRKRDTRILLDAQRKFNDSFDTFNHALSTKKDNDGDDECDLYAKLLAKKLRKYPDNMRDRIMYQIDGLLLNNFQHSQLPSVSQQTHVLLEATETAPVSPYSSTAPSPATPSSAPSPDDTN
ncbi:hypothetical protein WDU94_003125 [Cyamophila willieti]